MAQVEFGIISIVGKNVVESELKLQIFVKCLMYYKFWGSIFDILQFFFTKWRYFNFLPIILALFSIFTHTDYSQNYSCIIRASLLLALRGQQVVLRCGQHLHATENGEWLS